MVFCFLVLQTAHEVTLVPWQAWNRGWILGNWRSVADKPCGSGECFSFMFSCRHRNREKLRSREVLLAREFSVSSSQEETSSLFVFVSFISRRSSPREAVQCELLSTGDFNLCRKTIRDFFSRCAYWGFYLNCWPSGRKLVGRYSFTALRVTLHSSCGFSGNFGMYKEEKNWSAGPPGPLGVEILSIVAESETRKERPQ